MPLGLLGAIALLGGYVLSKYTSNGEIEGINNAQININPLDLGMALLIAIMFVIMSIATNYLIAHYGISGLNILAFISGFTDIDPFILSLINTQHEITSNTVICAILIAVGSNNLLKGLIAFVLSSRRVGWMGLSILSLLSIMTFALAFLVS